MCTEFTEASEGQTDTKKMDQFYRYLLITLMFLFHKLLCSLFHSLAIHFLAFQWKLIFLHTSEFIPSLVILKLHPRIACVARRQQLKFLQFEKSQSCPEFVVIVAISLSFTMC
jgi:hypothetical protein